MNPSSLLTLTFVIFLVATGTLFFGLWALWAAPRRIRHAVSQRFGPFQIRAAVRTSPLYWLFMLLVAVVVALAFAYLCWLFLAFWLYQGADNWQTWLAMKLNQTFWVWQPAVLDLGYDYRIVPLDVILCVLLGVFAGTLLGTWLGTLVASRRFLITRNMF